MVQGAIETRLNELAIEAVDLARDEPLIVFAAIVIVFIFIFVLAWRALLPRSRGKRFQRAIANFDDIAVLTHPNPDPDSMATALGVADLATRVNTTPHLFYPGQIRHQENRAFRTVLDLEAEQIDSARDLPDHPVVLVDHHTARDFDSSSMIDPFAIIDHHPGNPEPAEFTDIRPKYGACASIIAEYYRELRITPRLPGDEADETAIAPSITTGLLYGILADTNKLTRGCSPAEFEASSFLYPGIDPDILDRIASPEVDAAILDIRARAIQNRDVRGPFVVSDVGEVTNIDAIPQAADELLQLEGITAVVVFGAYNDTLYLSGRSRDDRVHMGDVLETAVEDVPMSDAGGHARMGGGQVSVTHLEGLRSNSGMSREEFTERLFDLLSGDQ